MTDLLQLALILTVCILVGLCLAALTEGRR